MTRAVLVLLAACGGSGPSPRHPEPARPDAYSDWHASRPKAPDEDVRTTKFEPPQRCGQGPYRFSVDTLSAPFAEGYRITICTSHAFKGSVSYLPPGAGREKSDQGFGRDEDAHHQTCRVDATAVATQGSSSSTTNSATKGKPTGKGGGAATTTAAPIDLRGELVEVNQTCPNGMQQIHVLDMGYVTGQATTVTSPLEPGRFVIEIWSELPNDLAGAFFLVTQRGVPAGFTVDAWNAYKKASDEWYAGRDAAFEKSRAQGNKWTTIETPKATQQPPPAKTEQQPPRPSPNAAWTPGYWQFTDGWVWSAGFWRVPPQDIEQEKTVEAPAPPPAPKVEAPPQADVTYYTVRKAVWTPGHWMWNGNVYIWIGGAWRIPEAVDMSWVAPTWRATRRGTLRFVPGGFVRRRR
jgi:hypothetical protein